MVQRRELPEGETGLKLTTHLHLVPRSRIGGAVTAPPYAFMAYTELLEFLTCGNQMLFTMFTRASVWPPSRALCRPSHFNRLYMIIKTRLSPGQDIYNHYPVRTVLK
jgi:hypothetical protein